MRGPLDVDVAATWQEYADYHRELRVHVGEEETRIRDADADLVLTDVPYVPIAAARDIGVPAIALCSLNWADVLEHYLPVRDAQVERLVAEIRACYREAERFITPTPSMPMRGLGNLERVGPIARLSTARPGELRMRLPQTEGKWIVLATMGGVTGGTNASCFPRMEGCHWVVPDRLAPSCRLDVTPISRAGMPFLDVLAGADVVLTKPGYGTFVEAACHGIPVVYVERDDWPESAALEAWLANHGVAVRVAHAEYAKGEVVNAIRVATSRVPAPRIVPTGVDEAVARIIESVTGL